MLAELALHLVLVRLVFQLNDLNTIPFLPLLSFMQGWVGHR